uniref:Arnp21 n=1 Tax=Asterias rubens TaxID=7604 RepID=A0A0U2PTF1_ASTRU|nr:Arnp21 [Asterias rubens]
MCLTALICSTLVASFLSKNSLAKSLSSPGTVQSFFVVPMLDRSGKRSLPRSFLRASSIALCCSRNGKRLNVNSMSNLSPWVNLFTKSLENPKTTSSISTRWT